MVWGTDVASYQPEHFPVDVGNKHLQFAFIKATEGTSYKNPKFAAQRAWAIKNNLRVGYYHFMHAGNVPSQVKYFQDFLASQKALRPGDMVACDWESYTSNGKAITPSNTDKKTFIDNALKAFPENRVVLYCNLSVYKNIEVGSYVGDGLWIADPSSPDGQPNVKDPWIFQQTSISGGQDINYCKFTRTELDKWADGKIKKTPAPVAKPEVVTLATLNTKVDRIIKKLGA